MEVNVVQSPGVPVVKPGTPNLCAALSTRNLARDHRMRRITILAGFFALSLATVPQAVAQQEQQEAPATEIDRGVVGLPIRSSDDQQVGLVTEAGIDDGEAILIGEIERPLGLGPDVVVITSDMFVNRGDHIELTLTAEQVRDRLARPER